MLATTDTIQNEPALKRQDTARYLGVAVGTLDKWRGEGRGPSCTKIEGAVRYRLSVLDQYIKDHTVVMT